MFDLVFRDFQPGRKPFPLSPSGRAWFLLDGTAFPEVGWSDLPLSMLGAAATAYKELRHGAGEARSFCFDGSFDLVYQRAAERDLILIRGMQDGDECLGTTSVPLAVLRTALLGAAEKMLAALSDVEESGGRNSMILRKILVDLAS
ncbi:hypothetical protein GCM10010435_08650 [Winogradskya consettensis]|uniref:Uncharacterized protein n=1 Tax=Winogradskya consettensis TaxID=113560 RepID=A0A919SY08_9ACTN|nr:hypothetical protein [Actinoplanes consettensis]GIM80557.1 hypothetical protein Aco04nite_71370 [Actinoplanes consettensis]